MSPLCARHCAKLWGLREEQEMPLPLLKLVHQGESQTRTSCRNGVILIAAVGSAMREKGSLCMGPQTWSKRPQDVYLNDIPMMTRELLGKRYGFVTSLVFFCCVILDELLGLSEPRCLLCTMEMMHLRPVDGGLQWILWEAAGRGRCFIRGTATFDWLPVCLAMPWEGRWKRPKQ